MSPAPLWPIARATLLEAWRGRLLWLWLALLGVVAAVAGFVAELTVSESDRFLVTWLAVGLRLAAVMIIAFFVAGSVLRERDEQRLQFVIALTSSRLQFILGKLCGAFLIALLFALTAGIALRIAGGASTAWGVSLLFELMLVAALTLFAAGAFRSVAPTLALVLCAYLLARAWPGLAYLSRASVFLNDNPLLVDAADLFALVLPRLDLFTRTAWLFDAEPNVLLLVILQATIYTAILILAAAIDFRRHDL